MKSKHPVACFALGASSSCCDAFISTNIRHKHNYFYRPSSSSDAVTTHVLFAGFGSSNTSTSKGKKKKNKSKVEASQNKKHPPALFTPQGRMEHITNRILSADISPIAKLSMQKLPDGELSLDIDPNGIAVIDNFLGDELITAMRKEAEALLPSMIPSQSTKWDESLKSIVAYDKKGVLSTQIEGGADGYKTSPRLVEYIVTLTSQLSYKLNQILPDDCRLNGEIQTNKLAVCLGNGSSYDKHIDNLGGGTSDSTGDRRKLTALLYLQPPASHEGQPSYPNEQVEDDPRGGYFRAYDVPEIDQVTCIAPRGDRLVVFWSDSLVHDVSPSFAPEGNTDNRWALTVWFIAEKDGKIRVTDTSVQERHFGN